MKAFIYNSQAAAEADNEACASLCINIPVTGNPEFSAAALELPYSSIITHPDGSQWALIADDQMESLLGKQAVTLDPTWQPPLQLI